MVVRLKKLKLASCKSFYAESWMDLYSSICPLGSRVCIFYVSITFNTTEVSESIQKRGGYIPGIRPGVETAKYLQSTSDRLNLFGGGFLALIAVFPYLMTKDK